jgi:phage terminase small subunit
MGLEGRAREIWDEHVARLEEWPWIDLRRDCFMLQLYCQALETLEEVRQLIKEDPSLESLFEDEVEDEERLVFEFAAEMGFTPASQRDIRRAMREQQRRRRMEGGDAA